MHTILNLIEGAAVLGAIFWGADLMATWSTNRERKRGIRERAEQRNS